MVAPHFSSNLDDAKRDLRRALRGATGDDAALRERLGAFVRASGAARIGAVWPLPGEPDLRPLLEALHAEGFAIALPVVIAPGLPLEFSAWHPGAALVPGPLRTLHPAGGAAIDPDLILVPLVAFDRACRRLGRGAGFYDRTLAARPGVPAIGFAHAAREAASVPVGPHDRSLDAVVTEREVIR